MKRKLWIVGLSVTALIALCVVGLLVFAPFSESTPTEQNSINGLRADLIDIFDIGEYYNYIAEAEGLPDEFVTAEMLSDFGRFGCFHADPFDSEGYAYCFITENGDRVAIYMDHDLSNNLTYENETLSISDVGSSMLELAEKEKGVIVRNGVLYKYVVGKLNAINWAVDDIGFTVVFSYDLHDLPVFPTDSLLYRMTSVSETEFASALTEMNAITTKNNQEAE